MTEFEKSASCVMSLQSFKMRDEMYEIQLYEYELDHLRNLSLKHMSEARAAIATPPTQEETKT